MVILPQHLLHSPVKSCGLASGLCESCCGQRRTSVTDLPKCSRLAILHQHLLCLQSTPLMRLRHIRLNGHCLAQLREHIHAYRASLFPATVLQSDLISTCAGKPKQTLALITCTLIHTSLLCWTSFTFKIRLSPASDMCLDIAALLHSAWRTTSQLAEMVNTSTMKKHHLFNISCLGRICLHVLVQSQTLVHCLFLRTLNL